MRLMDQREWSHKLIKLRRTDRAFVDRIVRAHAVHGMLCSRSSAPAKHVKFACDPSDLEFRFHLYAETDPGNGTTRTVSELEVFSECVPCWLASSMSRFKTS